AAANHVLVILAHQRAHLGLPALSIKWGAWAGAGMTTDADEQWLARTGVRAFRADEGVAAFTRLLGSNAAQHVAANVDWNVFKPVFESKAPRPFLEEMDEPVEATGVLEG